MDAFICLDRSVMFLRKAFRDERQSIFSLCLDSGILNFRVAVTGAAGNVELGLAKRGQVAVRVGLGGVKAWHAVPELEKRLGQCLGRIPEDSVPL
jgi:hypothetical protein